MVSCFLTPDTRTSRYTYPPELKDEIEQVVGHYMVDVENFRSEDKDRLLDQIEEMTERGFRLAEHLLETRPWDLFFMVEMGTDRIHHGFWRFTDSEHRLFEPGNPYEHAMLDYYRRLDAKIARLLRFADDETAVLVVSDHGAKRMDGGTASTSGCGGRGTSCCTRSRASRRGSRPTSSTGRAPWRGVRAATTAASSSTSRGASRKGVVSPDDYERVGSELKERLEALGDD